VISERDPGLVSEMNMTFLTCCEERSSCITIDCVGMFR
jgi:hypothetical protein